MYTGVHLDESHMEKDTFQRTYTHPLITLLGFGCVYERFETGSLHVILELSM